MSTNRWCCGPTGISYLHISTLQPTDAAKCHWIVLHFWLQQLLIVDWLSPWLSASLQRPDSKNWRSDEEEEEADWELRWLLTFSHPALPKSVVGSGARSCGQDVNWDWNNKSEPFGHLELTKEEAAEVTWTSIAVLSLDLTPVSLFLAEDLQPWCTWMHSVYPHSSADMTTSIS